MIGSCLEEHRRDEARQSSTSAALSKSDAIDTGSAGSEINSEANLSAEGSSNGNSAASCP
jgi:hypothetical protein